MLACDVPIAGSVFLGGMMEHIRERHPKEYLRRCLFLVLSD